MKPLRGSLLLACLLLIFGQARLLVYGALDVSENGGAGDGLADVWQMKFGASGMAASADTDGDGRTNAQEAGAGTDPRSPSDTVRISGMQVSGSEMTLRWPSVAGKRYKVQSTTTLSNPGSWADATPSFLEGSGAELSHTLSRGPTGTFYRVTVYDKDTDGDGVSDWEELQLGTDPENGHSNGPYGLPDMAFVTQGLQGTSTITIAALDGVASEPADGVAATDTARFVITRTGGFKPLSVAYTVSGPASSGSDFAALSGSAQLGLGAKSVEVTLVPLADASLESPEAAVLTLTPAPNYTLGNQTAAAVLINDLTTAPGTGLRAEFFNEAGTLNPDGDPAIGRAPTFANRVVSRVDAVVDYTWAGSTAGTASPHASVTPDYFASRWTGEVMPEFSQVYTFETTHNRCARLWVNGQLLINKWPGNGDANDNGSGTYTGTISLTAGVRYSIALEHFETTGDAEMHLRWQSLSQPKEIIPTSRMFADTPPQIAGPTALKAFVGGPSVNFQIIARGNPVSYGAVNLPPGMGVDPATGVITGTPTSAGIWESVITATNAHGTGSAILNITSYQAGGSLVREVWTGVPGTSLSTIPLATVPSGTSNVNALRGPVDAGDGYGARMRGYLLAPATGTYQFWLAGDDAAALYISNDDDVANSWLRVEIEEPTGAPVSSPIVGSEWATAAKSPLIYLEEGARYYIEVLHKEGSGGDHVAVAWSKPGQPTDVPSEIVPGYLLSAYSAPAPVAGESTLFTANMTAQGNAVTGGFGNATLQLNSTKTEAVLRFSYGNLTGPVTQKHVHSAADGGLILFDLDTETPAQDGSYTWPINAVLGVSDKDGDNDSDANDVVRLLEDGAAYLNLHTAANPAGEIKGTFTTTAGSQLFVAPANPPSWTDDHSDFASAARFLGQATFGASTQDVAALQAMNSYEEWIEDQFAKPVSKLRPWVEANRSLANPGSPVYGSNLAHNSWWRTAVTADDQLRQRIAFALSQILVVSTEGPLEDNSRAVSDFYDMLVTGFVDDTGAPIEVGGIGTLNAGAFGNFRDILLATSLHPAMGRYLDMLRNDKPDLTTGRIPNENYAREILQLFSIGLYRMHPDGSLVLDSKGLPIPTYGQEEIIGFAHAFTGWEYFYTGTLRTSFGASSNWIAPMREVPARHFTGPKRILNNVILPGLPTINGQPLDPYASHSSAQRNHPAYQALPVQEILATHDQIFEHPNVGPFICRQLIQRLVTSAPSRGYLYRVVSKFNDNGQGVRGDMKAVIKAILLDYEARSPVAAAQQTFGKQREPVLRIAQMARAFKPAAALSGTYRQDGGAIIVTVPTAHRLGSGQAVSLSFAGGDPMSTSGNYVQDQIGSVAEHAMTTNTFAVRTKDCIRSDYTQNASTTVAIKTQVNHGFATGDRAYIRFRTPTAGPRPANGLYPVTVVDGNDFTITVPSGTSAGKCDVAFLRGGYSMPRPPDGATDRNTTVTVTTTTLHGLSSGANVYFRFDLESVGSSTYAPAEGLYQVTVTSPTTMTFTAAYPEGLSVTSGPTLTEDFDAAPEIAVLDRGGTPADTVETGYSNYTVDNTETALGQNPLRSPTVFNYFLPDYQHSGVMEAARAVAAASGKPLTPGFQLTTPEFQITSDTNVVNQANFLYEGLFSGNISGSGISSFRSGGGDLAMDIGPWMGLRPGATGYWTDHNTANPTNDNLRNLIRQLGMLLMGKAPSAAVENAIYNWVSNNNTSNSADGNLPYTTSAPTESQRRDRARAVIHLLVTSPEYTIQK
jgi:uncharacterized protein (DUF1800 family)